MGKLSSFMIGGVVGALTGLAIDYLFGPVHNTTYDERYRSRLDHALEEGQKAADAQEAELRRKFEDDKRAGTARGLSLDG